MRKVKCGWGGVGGVVACKIILSAPVPFLFLWTLDFNFLDLNLCLGFGTWIWDLELDLGLTIMKEMKLKKCCLLNLS